MTALRRQCDTAITIALLAEALLNAGAGAAGGGSAGLALAAKKPVA